MRAPNPKWPGEFWHPGIARNPAIGAGIGQAAGTHSQVGCNRREPAVKGIAQIALPIGLDPDCAKISLDPGAAVLQFKFEIGQARRTPWSGRKQDPVQFAKSQGARPVGPVKPGPDQPHPPDRRQAQCGGDVDFNPVSRKVGAGRIADHDLGQDLFQRANLFEPIGRRKVIVAKLAADDLMRQVLPLKPQGRQP